MRRTKSLWAAALLSSASVAQAAEVNRECQPLPYEQYWLKSCSEEPSVYPWELEGGNRSTEQAGAYNP